MAVEQDFSDHNKVLLMIAEAQDAEEDQRNLVEDQKVFILEPDGQWDDKYIKDMSDSGKYRGTFDQVSPILDQITGEMDQSEFAIEVSPAGGDATEETAKLYSGLIRNIENISNADQIYSAIGESVVMAGYDGFEVVQEFIDANTFDQDLIFKPVSDFYKSVWFDLASVKQDKSDSNWGIKLRSMPAANYDKQFPDGSGQSIGDTTTDRSTVNKYESVITGKLYYKKPIKIELARMTNGAIYVMDDKFNKLQDEFAAQDIIIESQRTRNSWRVWSRLLDGGGWLTKEQETVFSYVPLVPCYGNYSILDTKSIYFGKTLKLMDSQQGVNFAISAEVEDVAGAPLNDVWMTKEQAAGEDYSNMAVDNIPVRYYNTDPDAKTPPFRMGTGKQGNIGLQTSAANFQGLLQKTGNMDDPSMGQNPGLQSGVAVNALVQQSNNGSVKWFKSMEIAICHAYKICVDAIPRVYDATRQQRILSEDGTNKIVTLNEIGFDEQTQQRIELNDLSKGIYDVTCSMGAAFKNQQEKTTEAILQYAAIDPAVMEMGRDILLKNQTSPGMDLLAARFRPQMIQQKLIPVDQLTEEEQQEQEQLAEEQAQQEQQPDPNMLIAQAEMVKGQAEQQNAQNKQQEVQMNGQVKMAEINLKQNQLDLDAQKFIKGQDDKLNVAAATIDQNQQKIDLQSQQQQITAALDIQKQQQQEINDAINNLKVLREASGIDSIIGVGNLDNIKEQTEVVDKKLDEQD